MNQPLAYVHPQAKIAGNVVIEPFSVINKNVVIEEGTWIGSNVTIMEGTRIGKNCRIFPGAVLGGNPQSFSYKGEETVAQIGDNTIIREFVTINKGTSATHKTVVGNNCLLMAYAHVAHDCVIGNHCVLANAVNLGGHVTIGDYAILGGLVAVHQFVNIGGHVMISGGSLVSKDVPPYIKAARNPLSFVGINSVGLRRRGFSNEKINEILDIYRILFLRKMNVTQAITFIETELHSTPEKDEIIGFVTNSNRGIIKGYSFREK